METGLEGKPWWVGLLFGIGVAAVLLFAGYKWKIEGLNDQIVGQEDRIRELGAQIRRGEAAKARLPQFEEKVAQLEEQLKRLLTILPDRRNVHDVLLRFQALAQREDFDLLQVTPGNEIEQEYFNEWPITLQLEGTYHNLARFFSRMSRFTRIFNVDDLKINATTRQDGARTIGATFVAKTFVYREDEEEEQIEGEAGP